MDSYVDRKGNERPLHNLYEKFSSGGEYGPTDDEKVCEALLELSTNVGDDQLGRAEEEGLRTASRRSGSSSGSIGNATDVPADDTITPLTHHVFGKAALPDALAAHPVLPGPGALPRDGRGAAGAQGPAHRGRRLSADHHRRPHALEHPLELARRQADAAAAARRAGDVHRRRRRRGARDRAMERTFVSSTTWTTSRSWPRSRRPCAGAS